MSTLALALLIPCFVLTGDTLDIPPANGFEFEFVETRAPDTVYVVSCDEFLFSPFGVMKSKRDLRRSTLRDLTFNSIRRSQSDGTFEYEYLHSHTSRLILFFDTDTEGERSSYIMQGEIRDSTIRLAKHVRLGMTKQEFVDSFFLAFPLNELYRARVFVFDTCLGDVRHFYVFEQNKLVRILFDNPESIWGF
jgi:hypothetical protein